MANHRIVLSILGIAIVAVFIAVSTGGPSETAATDRTARIRKEADEKEAQSAKLKALHQADCSLAIIAKGDATERARAIAILRNLGDEALVLIREQFAEMDDGRRRDAAAFALAAVGDAADQAMVHDAFRSEGSAVRPLMALAAASLQDPQLVHYFEALKDSTDATIRESVAIAYRASNTPDAKVLIHLLADAEPRVQAAASQAFVMLLPKMRGSQLQKSVEFAAQSRSHGIRAAALQVCAKSNEQWAVDAACKATRDPIRSVRAAAVRALGSMGEQSATPHLVALMNSGSDRDERAMVANALAKITRSQSACDQLAKAAKGSDPMVGLAAARALVAHQDKRGIEAMIALQGVKQDAARNVDDEDAMLLTSLSTKILKDASRTRQRGRGESWQRWWKRVNKSYKFPRRGAQFPAFPENH